MDDNPGFLSLPRPAWDAMIQVIEQAWNIVRQVDHEDEFLPVLASRLRVALIEFEMQTGWKSSPESQSIDSLLRSLDFGGEIGPDGDGGGAC